MDLILTGPGGRAQTYLGLGSEQELQTVALWGGRRRREPQGGLAQASGEQSVKARPRGGGAGISPTPLTSHCNPLYVPSLCEADVRRGTTPAGGPAWCNAEAGRAGG